jgi:hypothetical protein
MKYCVVRKNNMYTHTHIIHTTFLPDFEKQGTGTSMVKFFCFHPTEKVNLTYQYVALKCHMLVIYGKIFSVLYDSKMIPRR